MKSLRNIHLLGTKVVMTMTICASVFLVTCGQQLVDLWTNGRVVYDPTLMLAFVVLACSQSHSACTSNLMSASNQQKVVLWFSSIGSVVGFAAGYVLAHWFGMAGFVFGLVAADAVICGIGLPMRACQIIGESRTRFFREVTIRSGVVLVTTYAGVALISPLAGRTNSFREFFSAALLSGALGLTVAYLVALNRFERNRLNAALAGMFGR